MTKQEILLCLLAHLGPMTVPQLNDCLMSDGGHPLIVRRKKYEFCAFLIGMMVQGKVSRTKQDNVWIWRAI